MKGLAKDRNATEKGIWQMSPSRLACFKSFPLKQQIPPVEFQQSDSVKYV